MNYNNHQFTNEFLDSMFSSMFVPLITRPTRITSNILIDNIFFNDLDNHAFSGLFLTDISDHFPVFTVISDQAKCVNKKPYLFVRDRNRSNMDKFRDLLKNVTWSNIQGVAKKK